MADSSRTTALKTLSFLGELNLFNYCFPAIVYFLFAFGKLLWNVYAGADLWLMLTKFLVILLWTYALNWLCKKGYSTVAWFLVMLPFAILFTTM